LGGFEMISDEKLEGVIQSRIASVQDANNKITELEARRRADIEWLEKMRDEINLALGKVSTLRDVERVGKDSPICDLSFSTRHNLSFRIINCLRQEGVETVEQLIQLTGKDISRIPNLGTRSLREIREKLAEHGLALKSD